MDRRSPPGHHAARSAPLGVLLWLLLCGGPAVAGPGHHHIGEAWEDPLERGVEAQRSAMRRRVPPETIVLRAARAAHRDPSVVKIYLWARACGLRSEVERALAGAAADEREKRAHDKRSLGDFNEAMSLYREVLQKAPRCYYAYHDMGVLRLQRDPKARKAAFGHLSRAYDINKDYTPTLRQIVRLYFGGKQFGHAVPLIERIIRLEPEDEAAHVMLVRAYAALKKYDLAHQALDPLIKERPSDPNLVLLRAQIDGLGGKPERAVRDYRRLARVNPNSPVPFLGIMGLLQDPQIAKQLSNANEDYLFALRGLRRLERDPGRIKKIDQDIAVVVHRLAAPGGSDHTGPPTTEQLLYGLESPEVQRRRASLYFLLQRKEPATGEVVRAVARHLSPKTESDAGVRAAAVFALGHMSGTRVIPVIRHAFEDPDPRVHLLTVDALAGIADRDASAKGPVVAILGRFVEDDDVELASAARLAILKASEINLPGLTEGSDDGDWRRAFRKWWKSLEGTDVLIAGLEKYHNLQDAAADQVLVPYLSSDDFYVFRAAYHALEKAAAGARGKAWKGWYAQMPRFTVGRLREENHAALRSEASAWVRRRPGA